MENHSQNENNNDEKNQEIELPNKKIDNTKETILNELGVVHKASMKDREILTKINTTQN